MANAERIHQINGEGMKKVIVTGATGFIGYNLVKFLKKENIEIIALVRKKSKSVEKLYDEKIRVVECEMMNYKELPSLILDRDIDCVFHTAWQGVSDSDAKNSEIQIKNLQYTLDLIESMKVMKIKTLVGCGSIHEQEAIIEMEENRVSANLGLMYKTAKTAAHWMGKAKCGSYGIRFFWPLINTYGEGEQSARLINSVIRKIYNGEKPSLSSGKQYYDFVHISDVARALYLIADRGVDGTNYVITSGYAKPLKSFLKKVGYIANELNGGTQIPLGFGEKTDNVISLPKKIFKNKKLKRDTGFEPKVSFEEGIRRTSMWIKNNQ